MIRLYTIGFVLVMMFGCAIGEGIVATTAGNVLSNYILEERSCNGEIE